jgi:hypothetical protein
LPRLKKPRLCKANAFPMRFCTALFQQLKNRDIAARQATTIDKV